MPPSPVRSLVVSSYGRILRALYSKQGLPWQVHDEVVRIDPDVRHGEELFARDTHAVLGSRSSRLARDCGSMGAER